MPGLARGDSENLTTERGRKFQDFLVTASVCARLVWGWRGGASLKKRFPGDRFPKGVIMFQRLSVATGFSRNFKNIRKGVGEREAVALGNTFPGKKSLMGGGIPRGGGGLSRVRGGFKRYLANFYRWGRGVEKSIEVELREGFAGLAQMKELGSRMVVGKELWGTSPPPKSPRPSMEGKRRKSWSKLRS